MNVFQLRVDSDKSDYIGYGAALVAASTYRDAVNEYILHGDWGEHVRNGSIVFTRSCDIPILGLDYNGGTAILVDALHLD